MNIEQLRKRKKELGYTNEQISDLSGVPLPTVNKIFAGVTKSPRYQTMEALERVLADEKKEMPSIIAEKAIDYYSYGKTGTAGSKIISSEKAENADSDLPGTALKKQGEYTVDDFYAMPDDWRGELIDGVIYDMSSPTTVHQMICFEIGFQLRTKIENNEGDCIPFAAPLDVQLDCDDRTMVEPDVIVVCDREKLKQKNVFGAPDLVMEVLSPSTRMRDLTLKLNKYMQAGVREYWTIDAEKERILVYKSEGEDLIGYYTFEDSVPVGIWDGECTIDFQKIKDRLSATGLL